MMKIEIPIRKRKRKRKSLFYFYYRLCHQSAYIPIRIPGDVLQVATRFFSYFLLFSFKFNPCKKNEKDPNFFMVNLTNRGINFSFF